MSLSLTKPVEGATGWATSVNQNFTDLENGVGATEVEVSLGSAPGARHSGRFTITDAAITATRKLQVWQAAGPYTNKGTRADEAEMDFVVCVAKAAAGSATVYWHSPRFVRGNFKFNYMIGV